MRRVRLPFDINGAALSATELELALNEAQRQAATKELEEARLHYREEAPRYLAGDEVAEAIQRLRRAEDNLENLETEHQELIARRVKLMRESRRWAVGGNA
jgi:predicted transcriptional regulator